MKLKFTIDKEYDQLFVPKRRLAEFEYLYKTCLRQLEYSRKEYQRSWNEIGDRFSDYIEKETGYKWFYNTYDCVVSVMHPGISNWGNGAKIVRWWKENAYDQRRITAHELIISHYFEIIKHHYKERKLNDKQIWALAEIAAFALTSLTEEARSFWPWDSSGYYTNHNYPEIVALQKKLKNSFLKRKSFDNYIVEGIELMNGE